jgi:oxalate decarboxylase/phosphoglucose isomerase-like protein (cupin superfamily)
MSEPIVVHPNDVEDVVWPGGGKGKRMITPYIPGSRNLLMGIIYVEPGKSPHRWHKHTYDRSDTFEIIYPDNFEEGYLIIKGEGILRWKVDNNMIKEAEIKEGDAIYFPPNVVMHELINTSNEIMIVVYAGAPPVKVKKINNPSSIKS